MPGIKPGMTVITNDIGQMESEEMSDRLLVLVRHGQSEWNLKNLFTGWKDPNLTELGVTEAVAAGRIGSLSSRFYGAPTEYSQRKTNEEDAPELLRLCREDGVDAAILVAL